MESYEIVEQLEHLWNRVAKNVPLVRREGKETHFAVFLQVGGLRIFVALTVGPRGGISEEVLVIDPSAPIVADRLLVNCYDGDASGKGAILPLTDLRRQVGQTKGNKRELALQICENAMWDLVTSDSLNPARLRVIQSTAQSVRKISGGLPSQGRQGGGAPGSY